MYISPSHIRSVYSCLSYAHSCYSTHHVLTRHWGTSTPIYCTFRCCLSYYQETHNNTHWPGDSQTRSHITSQNPRSRGLDFYTSFPKCHTPLGLCQPPSWHPSAFSSTPIPYRIRIVQSSLSKSRWLPYANHHAYQDLCRVPLQGPAAGSGGPNSGRRRPVHYRYAENWLGPEETHRLRLREGPENSRRTSGSYYLIQFNTLTLMRGCYRKCCVLSKSRRSKWTERSRTCPGI